MTPVAMTTVLPLVLSLFKLKFSVCLNQGPSTSAILMTRDKTIWEPCLLQAGSSVPLQRVKNKDIWFLAEGEWGPGEFPWQ